MMDFLPEHEFGHLSGVVGRPGLDHRAGRRQQQVFGFLMQHTLTDRNRAPSVAAWEAAMRSTSAPAASKSRSITLPVYQSS